MGTREHQHGSVVDLCSRLPARFGHLRDAPHQRLRSGLSREDDTFPPPHEGGGRDTFRPAGFGEVDTGGGGRLFDLAEVRREHARKMMQDCITVNAGMQRAVAVHYCKAAPMDARAEYRAWMKAVMDARGWSARQWAMKAGVAGSTITRLFSDDCAPLPTYGTLMKLAAHAPADLPVPVPSGAVEGPEEPDEIELFKQLPPDRQKLVSDLIHALSTPPVASSDAQGDGTAPSPNKRTRRAAGGD